MNTPDTEWEKLANMVIRMMEGTYNSNDARKADVKNAIKSSLTSRDTYWKERVERIMQDNKNETLFYSKNDNEVMRVSIENFIIAVNDALLTNEDNLK